MIGACALSLISRLNFDARLYIRSVEDTKAFSLESAITPSEISDGSIATIKILGIPSEGC